jgi:hypothetical protein
MLLAAFLKQLEISEGAFDILLYERDRLFSAENLEVLSVNLNEHQQLLSDFVVFQVKLFQDFRILLVREWRL